MLNTDSLFPDYFSDVVPNTSIRRSLRQVGIRGYHRLVDYNYEMGQIARPVSTPAGTIRSYELVESQRSDELLAALAARMGPADVLYDIGAYRGLYALALVTEHSDRLAITFEPNEMQCSRIDQNRQRTDPAGSLLIKQLAVGAHDDSREFCYSSFPKLSSFDPEDATRWGAKIKKRELVPVRQLDTLASSLPPPDHIKIDVEGHGPAVLNGGIETIEQYRPTLYIEPHDRPAHDRSDWILSWCSQQDYETIRCEEGLICTPK